MNEKIVIYNVFTMCAPLVRLHVRFMQHAASCIATRKRKRTRMHAMCASLLVCARRLEHVQIAIVIEATKFCNLQ